MGWIRTRPDYHVCAPPTVLWLRQEGDHWYCDQCGTVWTVVIETEHREGWSFGRKVMRRRFR